MNGSFVRQRNSQWQTFALAFSWPTSFGLGSKGIVSDLKQEECVD